MVKSIKQSFRTGLTKLTSPLSSGIRLRIRGPSKRPTTTPEGMISRRLEYKSFISNPLESRIRFTIIPDGKGSRQAVPRLFTLRLLLGEQLGTANRRIGRIIAYTGCSPAARANVLATPGFAWVRRENRAHDGARPPGRPPEKHKDLEYRRERPAPVFPRHFTGITLVPPWTYPGTIEALVACLIMGHPSHRRCRLPSRCINNTNLAVQQGTL